MGRREGGFLEVLAFDAGDGKVLCLFETRELATAFAKLNPEVRDQGWSVHIMTTDRLPDLVENFDYVTIDPSPQLGAGKELLTALGFAKSLRRDNIPGFE